MTNPHEETKALSPEVKGLFQRIEQQADEYEKAFEELDKLKRETERINRENKELILEFKRQAEKAIGLIDGNMGIVALVNDMREVSNTIDKKLEMIDNRITLLNISNRDTNAVKNDCDILKTDLENLLSNIEQRVKTLIAEVQSQYNTAHNNAVYNLETRTKDIIVDVKNTQTMINSKIRKADERIETFITIAEKLETTIATLQNTAANTVSKETLQQNINELRTYIENTYKQITNKLEEIENNMEQSAGKRFKRIEIKPDDAQKFAAEKIQITIPTESK